MVKTYVVFIGCKPGLYDTWEETQKQVNKFSGSSHRAFSSRDDALKAFNSFMDKEDAVDGSTVSTQGTSYASGSGSANASSSGSGISKAEQLVKLNETLSNLNELMEEVKQQIEALKINSDN